MASQQVICIVYYNGSIVDGVEGKTFVSDYKKAFKVHSSSNLARLKNVIKKKLQFDDNVTITDIVYRHLVFFGENTTRFELMKVCDDEDVELMFDVYAQWSQLGTIELYITFESGPTSQHNTINPSQPSTSNIEDDETYFDESSGDSDDDDIDEDMEAEDQLIPPVFDPPFHMKNINLSTANQPTEFDHMFIDEVPNLDGTLEVGMKFQSKDECVHAIKRYHLKQSLNFVVQKSDLERLFWVYVPCISAFKFCKPIVQVDGTWLYDKYKGTLLVAVAHDGNDNIIPIAYALVEYRHESIKSAYNKTIEQIYGNWEESYNQLPRWLLVMQTFAPGTIIKMETILAYNEHGLINGMTIFHRLFWAYVPCISAFKFCKPIVQVDGTWLYSKYKGTLLVAVAQDGNDNIIPIAYALVESETKEAWSFFLRNLRSHVTPQGYCYGYSINESTYRYYRREIGIANPEALKWLDNIPRQDWIQAFDGGSRWGQMTTNLVESMNAHVLASNMIIEALYPKCTRWKQYLKSTVKRFNRYQTKDIGHNMKVLRASSVNLHFLDPEIDMTFYLHRRIKRAISANELSGESDFVFNHTLFESDYECEFTNQNMDNITLRQFVAPYATYNAFCIEYPEVTVPFELKYGLIHV
ncbi:uncharacterized protein [Cicer arietinum]|uniref:Uncharacterized protein LOC101498348 n=1 Tax=Cicer arietinum TaxID=3827 RepID=A0A1S3DZ60_CICAR|nr:uncharacterized protein LOC101498348 [Cicer arietinum]